MSLKFAKSLPEIFGAGRVIFDAALLQRVLRSIEARLTPLEEQRDVQDEAIKAVRALGLARINDVLQPALADIAAIQARGFLIARSSTPVALRTGDVAVFTIDDEQERSLFSPSPWIALTREATPDDFGIARLVDYDSATGELTVAIERASGAEGPHGDWVLGALAGSTIAAEAQYAAAEGFAAAAGEDAAAAAAQAGLAQTARSGSETARTGAQTALSLAQTARAAAEGFRDQAGTFAGAAETARDSARADNAAISEVTAYARAMAAGAQNFVLNPQGAVNQEGAGFVNTNGWPADQWRFLTNGTVTGLVSTFPAPNHIKSALRMKSEASHAAGSFNANVRQSVEFARLVPLRYGGENAKPSGLSFWVWATVPGLYSVSIRNATSTRTFLAGFTVDAPNKWEFKTVAVPPETDAGWGVPANLTDLGAYLTFHAAVMPVSTGVAGWQNGNFLGLPGQAAWGTATDQTFYVSQIVWAPGAEMMTEAASHAAMRPYADELRDCQRYYWRGKASNGSGGGLRANFSVNTNAAEGPLHTFQTTMRVSPAVSIVTPPSYLNASHNDFYINPEGFVHRLSVTAGGNTYRADNGVYQADARL